MDIRQALKVLKKFQESCTNRGVYVVLEYSREEIVEAFTIFWDSKPTMEQYVNTMGGCTVYPEFVYLMCTKRWQK